MTKYLKFWPTWYMALKIRFFRKFSIILWSSIFWFLNSVCGVFFLKSEIRFDSHIPLNLHPIATYFNSSLSCLQMLLHDKKKFRDQDRLEHLEGLIPICFPKNYSQITCSAKTLSFFVRAGSVVFSCLSDPNYLVLMYVLLLFDFGLIYFYLKVHPQPNINTCYSSHLSQCLSPLSHCVPIFVSTYSFFSLSIKLTPLDSLLNFSHSSSGSESCIL